MPNSKESVDIRDFFYELDTISSVSDNGLRRIAKSSEYKKFHLYLISKCPSEITALHKAANREHMDSMKRLVTTNEKRASGPEPPSSIKRIRLTVNNHELDERVSDTFMKLEPPDEISLDQSQSNQGSSKSSEKYEQPDEVLLDSNQAIQRSSRSSDKGEQPDEALLDSNQSIQHSSKSSDKDDEVNHVRSESEQHKQDDYAESVKQKEQMDVPLTCEVADPEWTAPSENSQAVALLDDSEAKLETELASMRGTPNKLILDFCLDMPGFEKSTLSTKQKWFHDLTKMLPGLKPRMIKGKLLDFLNESLSEPGIGDFPSVSKLSDPVELINALGKIGSHSKGVKMHEAFGQMKFNRAVKNMVSARQLAAPQTSGNRGRKGPHIQILEELALQNSKNLSPADRKLRLQNYNAQFRAGESWAQVAKKFEGPGIVMILIIAGVNPHSLNNFQRDCLAYFSDFLFETKRVVERMGADCLFEYCTRGCLPQKVLDNIQASEIFEEGTEEAQKDTEGEKVDDDGEDEEYETQF